MSSLLYQLSYSLIIIILAKQASTHVKPYLCTGRLAMLWLYPPVRQEQAILRLAVHADASL